MSGQVDFQPLGSVKHCPAPPWRDLGFSFPSPVAYRLDREARSLSNRGRAVPESLEYIVHRLHADGISENRINTQAPNYPILEGANHALSVDYARMESAFDVDLVKAAMAERKATQSDLAKVAKLPSQSAMSNILKGKRKVTADEAAIIYRFLGIAGPKPIATAQNVPIIGFGSASSWREAVHMPIGSMTIPPRKAGPKAFAIEIQGDSLDMKVADGGYVVVDPEQKELRPGKLYLIQNREHETTVKCYERDPARFVPMSSNPIHQPIPADEVDVIIGRVCWRGDPL